MATKKKPPATPKQKPPAKTATTSTIAVGDLIGDQANARTRDARARSTIAASLRQFGPARSIVLDERGVVRAGNGTLDAYVAAGGTDVLVVDPKPGQLVAVRRRDWSPTEATGYTIADNRTAELAGWDEEVLTAQLNEIASSDVSLDALGFDQGELDDMIAGLSDETPEAAPGDADAPVRDYSPAIRFELVFDSVEQQKRWFAFVRYLRGSDDFHAETIGGSVDLYIQSLGDLTE